MIQIKAEVKEVDELKLYQPLYKFNFSEKHKIIELKICEDCFIDIKQIFINENRLINEYQESNSNHHTGLDMSFVNFQDEESDIKETKDQDQSGRHLIILRSS